MNSFIEQYIARIVAFILAPILLTGVTTFAVWLQSKTGVELNTTELTAYIVTIAIGVAIAIYRWLANRIKWELADLDLQKYLAESNVSNALNITLPDNAEALEWDKVQEEQNTETILTKENYRTVLEETVDSSGDNFVEDFLNIENKDNVKENELPRKF